MRFSAIAVMALATAGSAEWTGNANVLGGSKLYDEDQWEPAEDQSEGGISVDFRPASWPVNLAIEVLASTAEVDFYQGGTKVVKLETEVSEVNLGVRKIWEAWPHVRPFLEAGLSASRLEIEVTNLLNGESAKDDGSGTGIWLGGGVYWTLWKHFNIGLYLKGTSSETEYETLDEFGNRVEKDLDLGGGHGGMILGFHW